MSSKMCRFGQWMKKQKQTPKIADSTQRPNERMLHDFELKTTMENEHHTIEPTKKKQQQPNA